MGAAHDIGHIAHRVIPVKITEIPVAHRARVQHQHITGLQRIGGRGRDHIAISALPRGTGDIADPIGALVQQGRLKIAKHLIQRSTHTGKFRHPRKGPSRDVTSRADRGDFGGTLDLAGALNGVRAIDKPARRDPRRHAVKIGQGHAQMCLKAHRHPDLRGVRHQATDRGDQQTDPVIRRIGRVPRADITDPCAPHQFGPDRRDHRHRIARRRNNHEPRTRGAFPEPRQEPRDIEHIRRRRQEQRIQPLFAHLPLQARNTVTILCRRKDQRSFSHPRALR